MQFKRNRAVLWLLLKVQVTLQAGVPQPILNSSSNSTVVEDDIDAALEDLQVTLEGSHINSGHNDIMQIPELSDYLRFLKYDMNISNVTYY